MIRRTWSLSPQWSLVPTCWACMPSICNTVVFTPYMLACFGLIVLVLARRRGSTSRSQRALKFDAALLRLFEASRGTRFELWGFFATHDEKQSACVLTVEGALIPCCTGRFSSSNIDCLSSVIRCSRLLSKCKRRLSDSEDSRRCHQPHQWLRSACAVRAGPTRLVMRCPRACRQPAVLPVAGARR